MKKVKLAGEHEIKYLMCGNIGCNCGYDFHRACFSTCAWFDIEDKTRAVDVMGRSLPSLEGIKVITCKGTPIGELVEEEVGE
jgi:hypothetical protein